MSLECELKYLDVDADALRSTLRDLEAAVDGPYFESNAVFDYEDRSLKKAGTLLRLRQKKGKAVLTVKKPPEAEVPSTLKVFEEIESVVDDYETVQKALQAVGFKVAFTYEKVREKWRHQDCIICIDRLPFGVFVEIEGTEETVPACAASLGLAGNATSKATYHALNIEYREKNGLDYDESFIFDTAQREVVLKEIGKE